MIEVVPTHDLKVGMYVAELDRPWLGTPFPFQGFLIERQEQIDALRDHCSNVRVDRLLSVGEQFRRDKAAPVAEVQRPGSEDALAFLAISRRLRRGERIERQLAVPPAVDASGRSRLDAELEYIAPIADAMMEAFESLLTALRSTGRYEIERVSSLIGEMTHSVQRNPDALLWLAHLRARDSQTYDHALGVSVHAMVFGRFLSLEDDRVKAIALAGLLQDVGKLNLDPALLAKATPLDDAERALVRSHVAHSLSLLGEHSNLPDVVRTIIAQHHERADGSGYPDGLLENRLDISSQVSGLVDTYCAMTERRPWRDAFSPQAALEFISAQRGAAFAEALADQFLQCIGIYPVGTLVELNSGEVGVVVQQNRVRRLQPRVLVLLGPDKTIERYPRTLDLLLSPSRPGGESYRILRSLAPGEYGIDTRDFFLD